MIFQRFNLLMQRNCLDNVCFPMELSGLRGEKKWREQRALELLDIVGLKDKAKAYPDTLSGGEQQMLAMGRALMANPRILLLDEPSMGLSPLLVSEIFDIIQEINKQGVTILLVEQNAKKALSIANRAYVLETGRIVKEDDAQALLHDEAIKKAYLGE